MFTCTEAQQWRNAMHEKRRKVREESLAVIDEAIAELDALDDLSAAAIESHYYGFLERLSQQRQQLETHTVTTHQAV